MTNPLLNEWETPFKFPPFLLIKDKHFDEAFTKAIKDAEEKFQNISKNQRPATFENTIEAMEKADFLLDRVSSVFFNLVGTDSNEVRKSIQTKLSPLLAQFNSRVLTNKDLWTRVTYVYENRFVENLSDEQVRVTELYYQMFNRAGAKLNDKQKYRYTEIMSRLAEIGTEFSQNLLSAEGNWVLSLENSEVEKLPDFLKNSMAQAASDRGLAGYALTLSRSILEPFLQFSDQRDLRQQVLVAWQERGSNVNGVNNNILAKEMLKLRTERAQILGYKSFSEFKLENQMAKNPNNVRDLLMAVWEPAKQKAEKDAEILETFLLEDGEALPLLPSDWHFYAEKYRQKEYQLSETQIKPYFQLEMMIEASFYCAEKLFGLNFERVELDLYHPDAKAWEVTKNGKHVALFIGDYYARKSKRSGAWCSSFRGQSKLVGEETPIAINVCNFTKPIKNEPSLLSFQDALTLFHEFGHALHVMLSNVTYPFVSCTSVPRDFVELPSQLYEHWLEVPEVLNRFAVHYQTGKPIPDSLRKKILETRNLNQGFSTVEYVSSALVDLSFHENIKEIDPLIEEKRILDKLGIPSAIKMRHSTPNFSHIFSGDGYSSGYYSYMWSEVMDADAFKAFVEVNDPFDPKTAERLLSCIYSAGGSRPPEELYVSFRGSLPSVNALLEQRGLDI